MCHLNSLILSGLLGDQNIISLIMRLFSQNENEGLVNITYDKRL